MPAPQNAGDAANKGYVDAANANALASPGPIGITTPNSATFTGLTAQTMLNDSSTTNDVNFIAQSLFKTPVAINRTLPTNNSPAGWVDSSLTIQQAIVPPGNTWRLCPSGGLISGGYQFNIPLQVGAFNCDNNAYAASTEPMAVIAGNLTLTPAASRQAMSVAEFNSLSHVPYSLGWDNTGGVAGSEFFNWGGLFTNISDGKGGVGVYVKSNFWNSGGPGYDRWSANKAFQTGSTLKPTTANGYWYQVTTPSALPDAGHTGSTEPNWCTSDGCAVHDGTITWTGHPQSGEGAWQIAYRAQDWLGAGLDIVNNVPYSTGYGIMMRAPDNSYPLNIAFSHGNPNAGGIKWVVGAGATPYTDWFSFYSAGDAFSRLTFKPLAETRFNSAGTSPVMINVDANSGTGGVVFGNGAGSSSASVNAAGDFTVHNLTVNGTCSGCGGGSGGGDLSSPAPIGNVAPNTGTFTTLTANSVNGTLNAAAFPGADPCAQINGAFAALPPAGGVVDASAFTASQISSGCTTPINASVAAATLRFGAGTWKLGGNPGINVTAPKVTIECPKASEGDIYNTVAATLMSNGAYPFIADTVQSFHSTDGLTVRNCYMDGNAVGTFGLFLPYGSSGHLENVYTRNFRSAGQFLLGGQWTMWASSSGGNGGDGLVLGFDSAVDGNAQFAGNGGSAVHVVSGGNVLHGVGTYKNRLHGIYLDGRAVGDWTGQMAYVQQSFIRPATGNAGSFVYFTQTAGTTGSTRPNFCQVPGCTFHDGSVTWINAGTGYGYTPGSIFENSSWNFLESANSTSNGFQAPNGFDADDIRIEGTIAHPAFQNNVSAAMVRQSEANDSPAHGIHLINTNYATINNVQWLGAGYSNNPDLGGLRFEASKGNTVSDVNCWFSYSNCLQLVSANNSTFSGLNVVNNGLAGTPTAGTYALSIDAASVANTVNDLNVRDDRGPAYSRGVADAGTQTVIGNYRKSNLAGNPDSYGAGYVQEFSTASAPTYNAGNGQGYTWKSGGTQTGQLDSSGNWTVSGSLSAQSIPGHEYFVSKYASIQAAIDAAYGSGTVRGSSHR